LNLRGSDIPYNPLFHAYLFVGLDSAVLFAENSKVSKVRAEVALYLEEIDVQLRSYTDLWAFLRRKEWGEGKVGYILAKPF
jgi:Xaa-Pro aminopeptidase